MRKIPAKINIAEEIKQAHRQLRVAAYCRVSTAQEEQLNSYDVQVRYYTEKIRSEPKWAFVGIFADRGLSGTSTKKRDEFNKMIKQCRRGKIDMIITKSISRFARNTADVLKYVRMLKEIGVDIFFEEQNIHSTQPGAEFYITIYGSIAQSESENISANVIWGKNQSAKEGKVPFHYKNFLGYRRGEDGKPEIDPEEAKTVKMIYERFLAGDSMRGIVEMLDNMDVPTPGGQGKWHRSTVCSILQNEKYIGDALAQKTFASAFPFVKKRNKGDRDQFYTENTHPAIISKEVFDRVQELFKRKSCRQKAIAHAYPMTLKILCGKCGTPFARREGRSGLVVWVCRKHDKNASHCPMGRIPETEIYTAFVRMYNKLKLHEGIILKPALAQLHDLNDALQRDNPAMLEVNRAIATASEQSYKVSALRSRGLLDADACAAKLLEIEAKLAELRRERRRLLKNEDIEEVMDTLRQTADIIHSGPERLDSFDEALFADLVEKITAESQTRIRFRLYGGIELTKQLREVGR